VERQVEAQQKQVQGSVVLDGPSLRASAAVPIRRRSDSATARPVP